MRNRIVLFALFWMIGLSLGYPTLNRYAPGETSSVSDARYYADIVERGPEAVGDIGHWRYRALVPALARPVFTLIKGHIGSWEPRYGALLVVNAAFCAGAALIVLDLGALAGAGTATALIAALLLLGSFNTPNFYLSGLVDSSELFVLTAAFWALASGRFALLPVIGVLGGVAKESTVPFMAALTGGWFLVELLRRRPFLRGSVIAVASVGLGLATVLAVRHLIGGQANALAGVSGAPLDRPLSSILHDILAVPLGRSFLYSFAGILPFSLFSLKRLPAPWLGALASALLAALVLAGWAGLGDNAGRPLFSTTGAILVVAAALTLTRWLKDEAR